MTELFERKQIEILVDEPLAEWLAEQAAGAGISHYSLLPVHSGMGWRGRWRQDDGVITLGKLMFVAVAAEAKVEAFIAALSGHIEQYGLVVTIHDVKVVCSERF
jgi:hypothetical protein